MCMTLNLQNLEGIGTITAHYLSQLCEHFLLYDKKEFPRRQSCYTNKDFYPESYMIEHLHFIIMIECRNNDTNTTSFSGPKLFHVHSLSELQRQPS